MGELNMHIHMLVAKQALKYKRYQSPAIAYDSFSENHVVIVIVVVIAKWYNNTSVGISQTLDRAILSYFSRANLDPHQSLMVRCTCPSQRAYLIHLFF